MTIKDHEACGASVRDAHEALAVVVSGRKGSDRCETRPAQSDGAGAQPPPSLKLRLAEVEKRIIAQEHRPFAILNDLRKEETHSDKWWSAAFALVVRLFLTNPAVTAGASVVAFAGVWFAYVSAEHFEDQNKMVLEQTGLIIEQNDLIKKQNEFFRRQLQQEAVQDFRARRAQLVATIFDRRQCLEDENSVEGKEPIGGEKPDRGGLFHVQVAQGPGCPASSREARFAAARTLLRIERTVRENPDDWPGVVVYRLTNLRGANLGGVILAGDDLRGADLRGANLRGANLEAAIVRGVNLAKANLRGVKLRATDLRDALLDGADLYGADLRNALLDGASLRGVKLRATDLSWTNLSRTKLSDCEYCPSGTELETRWDVRFPPPDSCTELPHEDCD